MFDLVIKNGIVIDGTGKARFRADLGVSGDTIAYMGKGDISGRRVINADGLVVSPGFIDIHSHMDDLILASPKCESKITQGVTTEVSGNCGVSASPVNDELGGLEWNSGILAAYGIEPDWHTTGEFLARLDRSPMALNLATLVGHGTVRASTMGYESRPPTETELTEMRRCVAEAMESGAFGLSSGLIYPPGCFASTDELIELARVAAQYRGMYATHLRNEAAGLIESVNEALRIGRESGARVQISHHKVLGDSNRPLIRESLAMIDNARATGQEVCADQYPYTAICTWLASVLPQWAYEGGIPALLSRLRDQSTRERLRQELLCDSTDGWIADWGGWGRIVISITSQKKNRVYEGLSIDKIAEMQGRHPVHTVLDLLLDEEGVTDILHFAIEEEDVAAVMRHSAVIIGSDSTPRAILSPSGRGKPHPRTYGTFPRVLGKYVREDQVLSLEEAVAKMTGRSAIFLALKKRGVLCEGNFADIVLFDPDSIADTATYENPHSYASGIEYVIVNGKIALEQGEIISDSAKMSGRVLRRGID